jgi:alkanesulfonate monooxygenase SsuD/methylene tetrahydromethanopterin reductase-like flavin-dependent oxidoreductase (luciferase family)
LRRSLFWLLDEYPETGDSVASPHATALEHARLADELGFTGLWLAEHHFHGLGTAPNPAVVLSALAQHTKRLRLGPAVSVLPLRNPIQVAEDYALVDILSGGRLNLGVGMGSRPGEFAGFGADFEGRAVAFRESLDELTHRLRAASSGERGAGTMNVAPVQPQGPPLYVASNREEAALEIGRGGDSLLTLVSPVLPSPDEVGARIRAHTRGLDEAGHDPSRAEVVVAVFAHVSNSFEEARRVGAPALGRLMQALTGAALPDPGDLFHKMAERGTGLFGSPSEVEAQLGRYAELGVEHVAFISPFGGIDAGAAARSLRALAPVA